MGKLQIRGDTTVNWSAANPVLANRELAVDTTLNKLKVGNGVTAWNSLGFCGGGGMWTLIERWEPAEAINTKTFSSLNGNVDRRYMLTGNYKPSGTASSGNIVLSVNSDVTTTNYITQRHAAWTTANAASTDTTSAGWSLGYMSTTTTCGFLEHKIAAKSGGYRQLMGMQGYAANGTGYEVDTKWGIWQNTTDNITQLVLTGPGENAFGVGTCIELWKLAQ